MGAGGGLGTRFFRFVAAQCEVGAGTRKNHERWDEKKPGSETTNWSIKNRDTN